MNRKVLAMIIGLITGIQTLSIAHTNIVGQLLVENFKNEIFVSAIMEKKPLTMALMNEADCSPKEMLSRCGSEYIQEHIKLIINGNNECLNKTSVEVQKDYVTFNYSLKITDSTIENLSLLSDYMLDYHEHSVLRVTVNVKDHNSSYDMKMSRQVINLNI